MKKNTKIIALLAVAVLCVAVLASCSTSSLSVKTDEKTTTITASNADTDMKSEGSFELDEKTAKTLDCEKLTAGKLKISFEGPTAVEITSAAKGKSTFYLEAGSYKFTVTPEEKASGTVVLRSATEDEAKTLEPIEEEEAEEAPAEEKAEEPAAEEKAEEPAAEEAPADEAP